MSESVTTYSSFTVEQNGLTVASGFCPKDDVWREAMHYAFIYNQDGPVKVFIDNKEIIDA